jgi:O-antigen/teichoic acid export membrane protein
MKALLKNTLAVGAGDVGMRVIGFLVTVYLARVLEPGAFGVISIGLAVLGHLQLVTSPGIHVIEMRNTAAGANATRAGCVLGLRLALTLLVIGLSWLVLPLALRDHEAAHVILLYSVSLIPMALFLDWYLQGREDFLALSAGRLAGYLAFALAAVVWVRTPADLEGAPLAFLAGNVVTAMLLGWLTLRRHGGIPLCRSVRTGMDILKKSVPVGIAMLFGQMVMNLPPLVVGGTLGEVQAGMYTAAVKLIFLFLIFDRVLNAILLPAVTRTMARNPAEVSPVLSLGLRGTVFILLPLSAAAAVLADWGVITVFGTPYLESALPLRILLLYVMLTLMNSFFVATVIAAGHETRYSRVMITGAVLMSVLVFLLTPWWGVAGAAAGVVGGELITVLLMAREASRCVSLPSPAWVLRYAPAVLVMGGAAWAGRDLSPGLLAPVTGGLGCLTALLSGAVNKEDVRFMRERVL